MIALLCSVQIEAEVLLTRIARKKTRVAGSKELVEGSIAGQNIVLCIGGMGKVNAAHAAALIITHYAPDALMIFGIGGAYPSWGAKVGDIAIASEEIAGDEGVLTNEGFKNTEYIGIPLLKTAYSGIYNVYPASQSLVDFARLALASQPEWSSAHIGPFVTLSTCTGTLERARELEKRYRGLCENMEGAAAAHVAISHNIPWVEIRSISNIVQDRDLLKWDIPQAVRTAQLAIVRILEAWK